MTYDIDHKFFPVEATDYTRYEVSVKLTRSDEEETTDVSEDSGLYNNVTNIKQFEFVNYKNEVEVRDELDEWNSAPVSMSTSFGENFLKDVAKGDFELLSEEDSTYTFKGEALSDYAYKTLGFKSTVKEAVFTLEGSKFTKFEVVFDDYANRYSSSDFGGARFTESLKISGEFSYSVSLEGKSKVAESKKASIDNVLSKFTSDNFTIQLFNPNLGTDQIYYQVLFNGEQIVTDIYDMFSESAELGTISLFDSFLFKDEESGKYIVKSISMNDDGEYIYVDNASAVKELAEEGAVYKEDSIYHTPQVFALDFTSIDSSLFAEQEDGTFLLEGDNAKYFGECLIPSFFDYSVMATVVGSIQQYAWIADSWTVTVLDENSLQFVVESTLTGTGSSSSASSFGFILTNPGTTKTDQFYTGELPTL